MDHMSEEIQKPTIGIQQQIVEGFIKQLKENGVSSSVVERIGKVITGGTVSDANIKKAIFPDESQQ